MLRDAYKIPIAKPTITEDDIQSVVEALRKRCLSSGEYVQRFEREFAEFVGAKAAVAVNSGTAALQVALRACGVREGAEVITTSMSFAATSNSIITIGARPVYADIEVDTFNLDPTKVAKAITKKTSAIMPIHYSGQCCEMDAIREVADKHDIPVIEDAAPAAGGLYRGKKAGTLGKAAGFSFFPDKNMTTGEGGMMTTDEPAMAEVATNLRKNGAPTRYYHVDIGWNFKMPDFAAALGSSQLKRLPTTLRLKNQRAEYYTEKLAKVEGVATPVVRPYNFPTFMLYAIRLRTLVAREKVKKQLAEKGIETRVNFPPIHLQPIYRKMFGYSRGMLPVTEEVGDTELSLPIYPEMTEAEQDSVVDALRDALR